MPVRERFVLTAAMLSVLRRGRLRRRRTQRARRRRHVGVGRRRGRRRWAAGGPPASPARGARWPGRDERRSGARLRVAGGRRCRGLPAVGPRPGDPDVGMVGAGDLGPVRRRHRRPVRPDDRPRQRVERRGARRRWVAPGVERAPARLPDGRSGARARLVGGRATTRRRPRQRPAAPAGEIRRLRPVHADEIAAAIDGTWGTPELTTMPAEWPILRVDVDERHAPVDRRHAGRRLRP